ncbi:hypothetical protein SBF1_1990001 [Candidatus Desulfosporosinus infrequens]|uniref:Uncharacterized protein n=1 Tax=Candidatus Desulfosporosinus infrequens TaxID=2043169 RepID=A0A2U3KGQ8_9FIRM|nr:hypothetical protein SBF1_1990001 [Candidatus Desulfosporosinus infrequens]
MWKNKVEAVQKKLISDFKNKAYLIVSRKTDKNVPGKIHQTLFGKCHGSHHRHEIACVVI